MTQKYSLQRRNRKGSFEKVATHTEPISPKEVQDRYGSGYYVLKSTKPRFKTIWKSQLGPESREEIQALGKRTKVLTYGFIGVAATEALGFSAAAWKFLKTDERIDKIEAVLQLIKPALTCPICNQPIDYYLQNYCSQCGNTSNWPRKFFRTTTNTIACLRCQFSMLSHQAYCPNCGQQRPIQIGNALTNRPQKAGGPIG